MRGTKTLLFTGTILALLLPALSMTTGCSKSSSSSSSSGSSILDSQTLSYIPASSLGFITWDTQSESYKKMKASPFAQQMNKSYELIKKAEATADAETKKFFKIYDSLIQTGLWTKSADQPEAIKDGVIFVDIDQGTKLPQIGFLCHCKLRAESSRKISAVQKIMNQEGVKTNPETVAGNNGFSISVEEAAKAGSPINKVFVTANADKISITSNSALAAKFFAAQSENGIQKIKESNEFKQATRGISSPESSMTFAYFDVNKLIASLESLGASTGVDAGAADLKDIPVESLAASSSMSTAYPAFLAFL